MKNFTISKTEHISPTLNSKLVYLNRIKKNLPVYNGGLGENPLPTPNFLIETLKNNAEKKEYSKISGSEIFREAIFSKYSENFTNTIVGNGLKELIFCLIFCWKGKIFLPVPCWVTYLEDMKILKKEYHTIPTKFENNYKLIPNDLEKEILDKNGQNGLFFLNNPNNPLGIVYSETELENLSVVFKRYNITVFSDEIYFNTSQVKTTSLSNIYSKCIIGSSLSKDWASGGWRFGWMIFSEEINLLSKMMKSFGSILYSCPSEFLNFVAAEALTNNNKDHFEQQKFYFKKIADSVEKELESSKIIHSNFEGAWYKWFDLKNYSEKLNKYEVNDSQSLTNLLGEKIGLIVVPGVCFGFDGLTFRLSMIDPEIYLGIREMVNFLNR